VIAFRRKPEDAALKVEARLRRIERENETSVKWDHRFGALLILAVAIAAMIGMAYGAIQSFLHGQVDPGTVVQFSVAFVGVLGMNRALLAAARNIRRMEIRGETPGTKDNATMYGVMLVESISFAYMLAQFEHPHDFWQWVLLCARAAVIPYATVYLEMQRRQPIDPVDIGVEAEIGQGLGVMGDMVRQAYDRNVPLALKLHSYRSHATMKPEMDKRLGKMTQAAQAYEHYRKSGEIRLSDEPQSVTPIDNSTVDAEEEKPAKGAQVVKRKRPSRKSKTPSRDIVTDEQKQAIEQMLRDDPKVTVRAIGETLKLPHTTIFPHYVAAKAFLASERSKAGPVRTGKGEPPPARVEVDETEDEEAAVRA
jgi:hypothetical protein